MTRFFCIVGYGVRISPKSLALDRTVNDAGNGVTAPARAGAEIGMNGGRSNPSRGVLRKEGSRVPVLIGSGRVDEQRDPGGCSLSCLDRDPKRKRARRQSARSEAGYR